MKLVLETFAVKAVEFGARTSWAYGTLSVSRDEIIRLAHDARVFDRVVHAMSSPAKGSQ